VAGYDLQKVWRPQLTDRQKERWIKNEILISAVISVGPALVFDKIMGVWVFQAAIIICTSLIPVQFGIFFGYDDEDIGTQIITLGETELWQEHGLPMIVPHVFEVIAIAGPLCGLPAPEGSKTQVSRSQESSG